MSELNEILIRIEHKIEYIVLIIQMINEKATKSKHEINQTYYKKLKQNPEKYSQYLTINKYRYRNKQVFQE